MLNDVCRRGGVIELIDPFWFNEVRQLAAAMSFWPTTGIILGGNAEVWELNERYNFP